MATFKAIVFTGKQHLKQDGTANIKIRIYHNGSAQYVSTDHFIKPDYLGSDGMINHLCSDSELLNFDLGELIQKYRKASIRLGTNRCNKMSSKDFKEEILNLADPNSENIDFVSFAKEVVSKTLKIKTADWYVNSINSFALFHGSTKIDVKDVSVKNLERYIQYLSEKRVVIENGKVIKEVPPAEPGTISNYLRGLRALYNKAKKKYNNEDLDLIKIPYNPFDKIKIPHYRRKKKNLSVDDLIRVRDGIYSTDRANMARDVFMMMIYLMGININDLYKVDVESYGRITYERSKTDTVSNNDRFPLCIVYNN